MENQNYHTSIRVNTPALEAFEKISLVDQWWGKDFEGKAKNPGDTFLIRFGETYVNFEIVESVPGQKLLWLVTDCNLHWLKDRKEWKGTKMSFQISPEKDLTRIHVTHIGLIPGIECYDNCKKGWDFYIQESL